MTGPRALSPLVWFCLCLAQAPSRAQQDTLPVVPSALPQEKVGPVLEGPTAVSHPTEDHRAPARRFLGSGPAHDPDAGPSVSSPGFFTCVEPGWALEPTWRIAVVAEAPEGIRIDCLSEGGLALSFSLSV